MAKDREQWLQWLDTELKAEEALDQQLLTWSQETASSRRKAPKPKKRFRLLKFLMILAILAMLGWWLQ